MELKYRTFIVKKINNLYGVCYEDLVDTYYEAWDIFDSITDAKSYIDMKKKIFNF